MDKVYTEEYLPSQKWRMAGAKSKQKSLGTEWVQFEPNTPLTANERPSSLVFELSGHRPLLCNNMFRFHIKAQFEKLVAVSGGAATWKTLTATDNNNLIFEPNWFEKLISSVDLIVGNNKIQLHVENTDVAHELNALMYYLMHPDLVNLVAPDPLNPVRLMPSKLDTNIQEASDNQKAVAQQMMSAQPFTFTWLPLHMFPFWQLPNHELDGPQVDLPLHLMGKMFININFKPQQHHAWRCTPGKVAGDVASNYRLNFKRFVLVAEENILPPGKYIKPAQIAFPCLIKDSKCENIPVGETEHRVRFSNAPLPESIFIFAVDKKVPAGNYNFGSIDYDSGTPYTKQFNIKEIELLYNNQSFTSRSPNFEQVSGAACTINTLNCIETEGLFGMRINTSKLPYNVVSTQMATSPYSFLVVYYTMGNGTRQRKHPLQTDGSALKQDQDMELIIRFFPTGAADATYVIYFSYTDRAMIYDTAANKFINPLKPYL